jgi:hypothetical protein
MAQNLNTIRAKVADLTAEIRQVSAAIPPVEDRVDAVRRHFREIASDAHARLVERAANVISHDHHISEVNPTRDTAGYNALGLAVLALGPDTLLAEAVKLAEEQDTGALRLTTSEKEARLLELRHKRYALELQEAEMAPPSDVRASVNGAAMLGIPVDVAEEFGLLGDV